MRCMERVTWKFTLACVKYIANGNLLYDSGNSNGICNNLEAWNGEGNVSEFEAGEDICIPMADLC